MNRKAFTLIERPLSKGFCCPYLFPKEKFNEVEKQDFEYIIKLSMKFSMKY